MTAKKGLFTASDWMAYYDRLFRDAMSIKLSPLSVTQKEKETPEKDKATKSDSEN